MWGGIKKDSFPLKLRSPFPLYDNQYIKFHDATHVLFLTIDQLELIVFLERKKVKEGLLI